MVVEIEKGAVREKRKKEKNDFVVFCILWKMIENKIGERKKND